MTTKEQNSLQIVWKCCVCEKKVAEFKGKDERYYLPSVRIAIPPKGSRICNACLLDLLKDVIWDASN